jgi:hypothetical protein
VRLFIPALALLTTLSAGPVSAQDLVSAQVFVAGLYAAYQGAAYHGNGPDYLGRQAKGVFSPRLLGLIHRDQALTPKGDVPALDGDPICDCQDTGGLKVTDLKVTAAAQGRATATVRLHFPDEARALKLDLVPTGGGWRVDDVHSADTPSLAAFLRRHAGGG